MASFDDEENTISKLALITAASRGIGAAAVRELAARDYRVVRMARSEEIHVLAKELAGRHRFPGIDRQCRRPTTSRCAGDEYVRTHRCRRQQHRTSEKGSLLELTDADWHAGLDLLVRNVVRMARGDADHQAQETIARNRTRLLP